MRIKSLIATVALGFVAMGMVGCDSSSGNADYVVTSGEVQQQPTGSLAFAFATAQTAFTVDANTARLRFEFFDGVGSDAVYTQTRDFATTITIDNVPVSATTVRITGFDSNKLPLFTATQAIEVVGGTTTAVNATSNAVTVLLEELRVVSGNLTDLDTPLSSLAVPVGGTFQTFLAAEYSSGDIVLVGELATYAIEAGGEGFATVNPLGTVSGLAAGTTALLVSFSGQQITVPVVVTDGVAINFTSIKIENTQPIQVTSGTGVPLQVVANNQFGLNPADSRLSYEVNANGFTVTNGVLNVDSSVAGGTTATVTATYTNPDSTTLTATASVQAVAP